MVKTVDARKKLVVDVTGKHIAKGSRHDSRNCALELAIEEALPGSRADVNTSTTRVLLPGVGGKAETIVRYRTSGLARKFIENFDAGKPMNPGKAELLAIPTKSVHSKSSLKKRARARREAGIDFSNTGRGRSRKFSLRTKLQKQAKKDAVARGIFGSLTI